MAKIEVTIGGKGVGIADQASIEPAKGCTNNCRGCYAAKTTRMGKKFFDEVFPKEYDEDVFRKSCKRAVKKGIRVVRMAKHCDPGDLAVRRTVIQILEAAASEGIQIVFVTKSLTWSTGIANALLKGKHILHISLGMITDAPSDRSRIDTYMLYKLAGVDTMLRIVSDVTKPLDINYRGFAPEDVIVTPMRFASKDDMIAYDANPDWYEWLGGYYRPRGMTESWDIFSNLCGEIGHDIKCSNCGVGRPRKGLEITNES